MLYLSIPHFIRASTGEPVSGNTYANIFVGFNADDLRFKTTFQEVGLCLALSGATEPPVNGIKIRRAKRPRRKQENLVEW